MILLNMLFSRTFLVKKMSAKSRIGTIHSLYMGTPSASVYMGPLSAKKGKSSKHRYKNLSLKRNKIKYYQDVLDFNQIQYAHILGILSPKQCTNTVIMHQLYHMEYLISLTRKFGW